MDPSKKAILVAFTTRTGTTAEVAKTIGEELANDGPPVDVRRVEEVVDLTPYSAVLIGAPMLLRWYQPAVKFVRDNQVPLAQRKVAYFFTASNLTDLNEVRVESIPVSVDPELIKRPHNPNRLTFWENYATIQNYLWPVLSAGPTIHPVGAGFFGGLPADGKIKWYELIFVRPFVQNRAGRDLNIAFIREWARQIRPLLLDPENS